jgi:5,10-methylenetetrahydromethanopterin reductase
VFPLGLRPLKVDECRRALARLRALLAGDPIDGGGDGELRLSFTPSPVPPVYFAGSQPRMLRAAGAVADGVIIMGPADPESVAGQLAQVDHGAREAGRDPADVRRDLWVTMSIGEEREAIRDVKSWASAQARWLTTWKRLPPSLERFRSEMEQAAATYDFGEHLSLRADHANTISDEFAQVLAVAGDDAHCRDRLRALVATGVDRVTITLLSGGRERRLADIARVWRETVGQPVA